MAAPRSGKYGNVQVDNTNIANLDNWTLSDKSELQPYASNETNGRRARVAGIGDSTGTITYRPSGGAPPLVPGTTYDLELFEHEDDVNPYQVTAIVGESSVNVSPETGAIISYTASWEENGAFTRQS